MQVIYFRSSWWGPNIRTKIAILVWTVNIKVRKRTESMTPVHVLDFLSKVSIKKNH
jgi:hypothetical protein